MKGWNLVEVFKGTLLPLSLFLGAHSPSGTLATAKAMGLSGARWTFHLMLSQLLLQRQKADTKNALS